MNKRRLKTATFFVVCFLAGWFLPLASNYVVERNREFDVANPTQDTLSTRLTNFYRDYGSDIEEPILKLYEDMIIYLIQNPTCPVK